MNAQLLGIQLGAVVLYMHLWFVYAALRRRNDIADVAWGPGFVLLAGIGWWHERDVRTFIVSALVAFWGFRLATHIFARFRSHAEEDRRYQEMRKKWGTHQTFRSWWDIFVSQGFFMVLVALPIIVLPHAKGGDWNVWSSLGLLIWTFGYVFETIGDLQLRRFLADQKRISGHGIMRSGLWKYTRHPNYFGEATLWWGMWLIAWTDRWWLTIIGPLTITMLLRFVSGVPLAERGFQGNKEFEDYAKKTPAMIPNPFL